MEVIMGIFMANRIFERMNCTRVFGGLGLRHMPLVLVWNALFQWAQFLQVNHNISEVIPV